MKPKEIIWVNKLDQDEVREAFQEACVDCYDEHEQSTGLATMIDQELSFPFPARVLGEDVEVVGSCRSRFDPLGLELVVAHLGSRFAIASHCVELRRPLPDGHLYLAAYLDWRSRQ